MQPLRLVAPLTEIEPVCVTIFDLDRTLTRHGTWSPFLIYAAARIAPWRLLSIPLVIIAMIGHKMGFVGRRTLKEYMQRCMMGAFIDRARAQAISAAFAERLVRKGCLIEGIASVVREKASGRRVILASAANRFYLDAVAARLGIAEVVGTQTGVWSDMLLSRISGENCYGIAKRNMLMAYLAEQGLKKADMHIRFYSDDASDLPTFDLADQPITVNATRALRRVAAERGWPALRWI